MGRSPSSWFRHIEVGALLLALATLSCATSGNTGATWPDSGTHPTYPPERYVLGVGWGDTMDVADDRARGEVAKFFRAKVVTVTREEEHYTHSGGKEGTEEHFFESITRARTRGDAVFDDAIMLPERLLRQGTHYTLAVLDKLAMRQRLEQELAEVEMEIAEKLESTAEPELRVRNLARALYLTRSKASLAHKLQLLGRKVAIVPEEFNQTARDLHQTLATTFPITVNCDDEELLHQLETALTGASLVVAPPPPNSTPITVQAHLDLTITQANGLSQANYRVNLRALRNDVVLAQFRAEERIAHPDPNLAAAKARVEIEQRTVAPFVKALQVALLGSFEGTDSPKPPATSGNR